MTDYKLEIKQIVDYPKCRIYRQFIQSLIADRSIRTNGCSGLFHYALLCCYANFRTSYQRYDGISYIVHPRSMDLPATGAADMVPCENEPAALAAA